MSKVKLSRRLLAVSSMVRENAVLADIGTDHGLLICYLAQKDTIKKGYACDINPNPLKAAQKNITLYNLEESVEVVLADGLKGLENKGVTDIVIAGMGGESIIEILEAAPWVKDVNINLILQAMSRDYLLREYLVSNGFNIKNEVAVVDGDIVYAVMNVVYDAKKRECSPRYFWTGLIWNKKDNDSLEYIRSRYRTLEKMKKSFDKKSYYDEIYLELEEKVKTYNES